MLDPRLSCIDDRLGGVRRIVAVTGGKGGIGKSTVASLLALVLAREGRRVGLFDLDFTGPTTHLLLGYPTGFPREVFGVEPVVHHGVACMSVAHFAGEQPAPLRGDDVTNALLELLAITRWGELDLLLLDLPPGLGDATLDVLRLLPRVEFLVVATASPVDRPTVEKTLAFLARHGAKLLGVVENRARRPSDVVVGLAGRHGVPLLGSLPDDEGFEEAVGDAGRLLGTALATGVRRVAASVS